MKHIFRRELLEQVSSFKFSAGLLLILALSVVNGIVFSLRYKNDVTEYHEVQQRWEEQLAGRKKLDDLPQQDFDVLKLPLKTAFLASGGQDRLPNEYEFSIRIWGSRPYTLRAFSQNALIEGFQALDWAFLLGTAFSLLALVFVYDAVSGEKARGTLKLLQTYNLSRNAILLGKLLANLVALLVMLVLGVLVSLLLILLVGGIDLGAAEWARLALFLALAAFYITLFLGTGLFLSTVTQRPASSMVLAVMVWVLSIVVLPGIGALIVQQAKKLPTQNEVAQRSGKVWDYLNAKYHGNASNWRGRDGGKSDNYLWERQSTQAQNERIHLQDEIWEAYLRQKFDQARFVRTISSVSPTGLFEFGAEAANGTGVLRDESLIREGHEYRSEIEQWIRNRDIQDPESIHLYFQPGYLSLRPLDVAGVPRYRFHEPRVADGLRDGLWRVTLLAVETLVTVFAAVLAFQRYDVR